MKRTSQIFFFLPFLYLLFLAIDLKVRQVDSENEHENTASSVSQTPPQVSRSHTKHVTMLARKQFKKGQRKASQSDEQQSAKPQSASPTKDSDEFTEKMSSSTRLMPDQAPSRWERQELRRADDRCPRDRDCTPRGKDGVLILGASFASHQPSASWQGVWGLGNNVDQSPLLNLR